MPRREYKLVVPCSGAAGCPERVERRYGRMAEYAADARYYRDSPWKCRRHSDPAGWLRPGNEEARGVMTAVRVPSRTVPGGFLDGLYWHLDGQSPGSSLCHGEGFFADANDFPEGTRLVVDARIILPETKEAADA